RALDREGIRAAAPRPDRGPPGTGRAFPHPLPAQEDRLGRGGGMRRARHAAGAIALGVLAACGLVERADSARDASAAASGKSTAEDLLAYLARMRGASESALAAEAARQKREPGDAARVKAALALALSLQSDDAEIAALVDAIARKEDADRDLRAM